MISLQSIWTLWWCLCVTVGNTVNYLSVLVCPMFAYSLLDTVSDISLWFQHVWWSFKCPWQNLSATFQSLPFALESLGAARGVWHVRHDHVSDMCLFDLVDLHVSAGLQEAGDLSPEMAPTNSVFQISDNTQWSNLIILVGLFSSLPTGLHHPHI